MPSDQRSGHFLLHATAVLVRVAGFLVAARLWNSRNVSRAA